MHFYTAPNTKKWDAYTINRSGINELALMERAAKALADWIGKHYDTSPNIDFLVVCGPGNNGGDGLALARLIHGTYGVKVATLASVSYSHCFLANKERLAPLGIPIFSIETIADFPEPTRQTVIVDALLGTGINRPPVGLLAEAIDQINAWPNEVISIDLPSGMYADALTPHAQVVNAHYTIAFQCPRLAFMMPENEAFLGQVYWLDIGLDTGFCNETPGDYHYVQHPLEYVVPKNYSKYSYKGQRGHLLLGAGSAAMMGAAVLATKAALRSGAGLVTVATETFGWPILQQAAPEAICAAKQALGNADFQQQRRISAIAVGPGWLADDEHAQHLAYLLEQVNLPLVIDATGLFLLGQMLPVLHRTSANRPLVITPHVGEFDRMFGFSGHHFDRLQKAKEMAAFYHITILLKGAYTRIVTPDGEVYFNSTGNHGMAKAGSGDVLAGLIGGLLAQEYSALHACILGAWLHGKAGDIASEKLTKDAMAALDLVHYLPHAWQQCQTM